MAQDYTTTIPPATTSGSALATIIEDNVKSLLSNSSGITRPSELATGGMWSLNDSGGGSPNDVQLYVYDGLADRLVGSVTAGVWTGAGGFGVFQNNVPVQWRNAANNADIDGLVLNGSDQFMVGNVLRLTTSGQVRAISSTASAPSFQAMSNDNIAEPTMGFVNSSGNIRAGLHAFPKGSATLWDMELKAGNFQTVMKLDSNLDVTVPSGNLRVGDDPAFTAQRVVISDSSATTRLRINSNAVSGVSSGLEIYTRGVFKGGIITQDSGNRLDFYGAFGAAPTLSLSSDQSAVFNAGLKIVGLAGIGTRNVSVTADGTLTA